MQLLLNQASPYARLARVVVLEKKLGDQVELRWTDPWASPPELLAANPAAKVPALVLNDGEAIVDSGCIALYLDQTGQGPTLFPSGAAVLIKYGLGRSLIDVAFGVTIERRYAPLQQPSVLIERWLAAIGRTISVIEDKVDSRSHAEPDVGDLAIAVGLAYVDFRLKEVAWRASAPRLAAWFDAIAARPSLRTTAPE